MGSRCSRSSWCKQDRDGPSGGVHYIKCHRHIGCSQHICSGKVVQLHKQKKKRELIVNDAKEPFKYIPSKTFSGSKNEISKVSPQSVINSVCRTRLFTRAGPDKESQTGSSGAMEGPEPRREKSCSFSQTPCRKKKKTLTTKEALCSRLFQKRVLARTDPPRAQVRWKEKEKKELYLVNNFHESVRGEECV